MDAIELTAAGRTQAALGGAAPERALWWAAPAGFDSPLGLRGLLAVADGAREGGELAAAMALEQLQALLTDPAATLAEDREHLADALYQAVRTVNNQLREVGGACGLTCLAVRDDGFALAHTGTACAYHMRAARVHALTTPSAAELGTALQPEVRVGTGDVRPGDRLILLTAGLSQSVTSDEVARTIGQADLLVGCDRLLRTATDHGATTAMTAVVGQVGPLPVISSVVSDATVVAGESAMSYNPEPEHTAGPTPPSALDQLNTRQWSIIAGVLVVLALMVGILLGGRGRKPADAQATLPTETSPAASLPPASHTGGAVPAPVLPGAQAPLSTAPSPNTPLPKLPSTPPPATATTGAKSALKLTAKKNQVTLSAAKDSGITINALGTYKVEPVADGWQVTLKSTAAGQHYRIESATAEATKSKGKTATHAAGSGTLSEKTAGALQLAPGKYKLLLGKGVPVAEIEVGRSDAVTPGAGAVGGSAGTPTKG